MPFQRRVDHDAESAKVRLCETATFRKGSESEGGVKGRHQIVNTLQEG